MELLNYRNPPNVYSKHKQLAFLRIKSIMNRTPYTEDYDQTEEDNELDYILKNQVQINESALPSQNTVPAPPNPTQHWNVPPINRNQYEVHDSEYPGSYRSVFVTQQMPHMRHIAHPDADHRDLSNKMAPRLTVKQHATEMSPIVGSPSMETNTFTNMTNLVNSNPNIIAPIVESTFVDHHVCNVCGKRIARDMSRHLRTHQGVARFTCKFPRNKCRHKTGRFNRPYDFKKHLLNRHFRFDDPEVKSYHNLSDKLEKWGACPCGLRFTGKNWLDEHILTTYNDKKCPLVEDR